MARSRTAKLSGNGKREFTITHTQDVKIKYNLSTGRSASFTWVPFSGGKTTDRHPVQVVIEGVRSGQVFSVSSEDTIGRRKSSTKQKLRPDDYIIYGRGAGEGNDRKSKIDVKVEYREGTKKTDDGEVVSFANISGGETVENLTPNFVKDLADDLGIPSIALMGGLGLLVYMLFIK